MEGRPVADALTAVAMMENSQLNTIPEILGDRRSGREVVLYPTFGHLTSDGRAWKVAVSGAIFEPGTSGLRRRMFVRVLQRLLRISSEELDNDFFHRRVEGFLVSTERGQRISIDTGSAIHPLEHPSTRNGHFRGSFVISVDEAQQLIRTCGLESHWLDYRVVTDDECKQTCPGSAQLIGPIGRSVISDIDDTIKQSDVMDRWKLLHNTFFREFEPVAGMAEAFQRWAAGGAVFHYVSSSPWQLYPCLMELLDRTGFPRGSFHLRSIHLQDPSLLRLFVARRATKLRVIRSIIQSFPKRKFVLVGDSGEKDPEIYGAIGREFPDQIQRIAIRLVEGRPIRPDRLRRALGNLDPTVLQVFSSADELFRFAVAE